MKWLEDFPSVAMFFVFFVSSCVYSYFTLGLKITAAIILLLALSFVLLNPRRGGVRLLGDRLRFGLILSLAAALLSLAVSAVAFDVYADGFDRYDGERDNVTLKITECDYSLVYTSRYQAKVIESEKLPKGTLVLLNTPLGNLEAGSVVSGEVEYTELDSYLGSFDAKSYYNADRIMLVCEGELTFLRRERVYSLSYLFSKISGHLGDMLRAHTDSEAGGLASAVVLGERSGLSDSDKRDFRRIGISHLLVVSGTHFSIIVSFAESSMKRLKLKRRTRALINIAVILFFMALTGMSPSVVRAGIMHILAQLSVIVYRRPNTINSFAISGCILILFNPLCACDCGLQMSFAASYFCIISKQMNGSILRPMRKRLRVKLSRHRGLYRELTNFAETALMTLYVCLNMLPLIWLFYGEASLFSFFSSLIFIPLVTLLIQTVIIFFLLYPVRVFIPLLGELINLLCSVISSLAEFFARADGIVVSINYSFSILFLLPLAALLLSAPFVSVVRRKRFFLSSTALILSFSVVIGAVRLYDRQNTYLSYTASGKNDGFVLKSDGQLLLCEISDASYGFMYRLTDEMEALHCTEIDAVLITHYHSKHLQLISRLCEREIVHELLLTEPLNESESSVYLSLLSTAEEHGIDVSVYTPGEKIGFGEAELELYERKYLSRSTHPITALSIEMLGEEVFIASESFNEMSDEVVSAAEHADYLILGHHSPVYKKTFGLGLQNPKVISLSSDAYAFSDDELKEYFDGHGAVIDEEYVRIKLRKN